MNERSRSRKRLPKMQQADLTGSGGRLFGESESEQRDGPCTGERCPGVLAGASHPDLCDECAAAFTAAGVATEDLQLELLDDEAAA
jgi:hypothetical protein